MRVERDAAREASEALLREWDVARAECAELHTILNHEQGLKSSTDRDVCRLSKEARSMRMEIDGLRTAGVRDREIDSLRTAIDRETARE